MKLTVDDWKIIDKAFVTTPDTDNRTGSALRDLFAVGCFLHATGKQKEGFNTVKTALRATSFVKEQFKTNLFEKIIKSLPGNEKEYLNKIRPHTELLGLLK